MTEPITWHLALPLCLCGHLRAEHDLDRKAQPCTLRSCGCLSWRESGKGRQTGRTSRVVDL